MTPLIIIISILAVLLPVKASAEIAVDPSYYYIVIDQETGDILLEQNAHERIFPASTTKILTAYTALSNTGATSMVTASSIAAGPMETGAVRLGLSEGEVMEMYDMLMALMLKSANDVAVAIAEHIGGSVDGFALMMNEMAESAGAVDTHFVNPHGLHDDNHYTTPHDLAVIARKALENYNFASIVSRSEYSLPPTNKREGVYNVKNTNPILGENEGMDFLVTGVKTGYTSKAKFTLVSSAHDYTGREVVCVVANIPTRSASADLSLQLIKKAFDDFAVQSISSSGSVYKGALPFEPAYEVATARNIEYLLPRDRSIWNLTTESAMIVPQNHKPEKGEIVGSVTFKVNDRIIGSSYLVAAQNLATTPTWNVVGTEESEMVGKASFPFRFIIPLLTASLLTLLFFLNLRYNKKEVEEQDDAI